MRRLARLALAALVLAAAAPSASSPAFGQAGLATDAPAAAAQTTEPAPAADARQALRRTADAPPRTLRAYWHVFGAFAFAWALLFGYAVSLGRRFGRLETELRRLEPQA